MEQRLSLITLGVADVASARVFYEKLGWQPAQAQGKIVFYQLNGMALALFGREDLAKDIGRELTKGAGAVTLAHNVRSEAEVDELMDAAVQAGAVCLKKAERVFWGGYSGYFEDPEGFVWEVAVNPFSSLDSQGNFHVLPEVECESGIIRFLCDDAWRGLLFG